ncbi:ankyrin repeat domain-containing protein (plasmid) [Embleya sp. NBC_00888]|uniref:ankyrin repeat domain-containing protein n=1 Tax=Embleya sp. NBC_00888 TaxID=2975960 RepID=UPI002F910214|nr:ankyrin repeat domain-containing protein [Embleya sp. NBC_00888]
MGFFDGLTAPEPEFEPVVGQARFDRLAPWDASVHGPQALPDEHWLPTSIPDGREIGVGRFVRLRLEGFEAWPEAMTFRVVVFESLRCTNSRRDPGELRIGLCFADGRRVTVLDGEPWPHRARPRLTLTQSTTRSSTFRHTRTLTLAGIPPTGTLSLVVEWPGHGVPETWTELDAAALRDGAARAVRIWRELPVGDVDDTDHGHGRKAVGDEPRPVDAAAAIGLGWTARGRRANLGRGLDALIPAKGPTPNPEPTRDRYESRADWGDIDPADWTDPRLVRTRLDAGADPAAFPVFGRHLLHHMAAVGSPEVVALVAERIDDVDLLDRYDQVTPLWHAVASGRADNAAVLLAAGADAWRPVIGTRSPGHLARVTPLAPLFLDLPGAVPLTDAERAAQDDADRRLAALSGICADDLGVAFVAGIDEDEVIRRLGGDPIRCPVLDLDREPGRYGTGPGGFDPDDFDELAHWVGITAVDGGCALTQPMVGLLPNRSDVLIPLSVGTTAWGIYFCTGKGARWYTAARDGSDERFGELRSLPRPDEHEDRWLYREWQNDGCRRGDAAALACLSARAGVRVHDPAVLVGPPNRWLRLAR